MIDGNKISIPWYRKNVREISTEISNTANPNIQFPTPDARAKPKSKPKTKPRTRTSLVPDPIPIEEPNPFRVPNTVPTTIPTGEGITVPDGINIPTGIPVIPPIPQKVPEGERNPLPPWMQPKPLNNPRPAFIGDFKIEMKTSPNITNEFILDIERIGSMIGAESRDIVNFIASYDMENLSIPDFNNEAAKEFGAVAGILLSGVVIGKYMTQLWGKRATGAYSNSLLFIDEIKKKVDEQSKGKQY